MISRKFVRKGSYVMFRNSSFLQDSLSNIRYIHHKQGDQIGQFFSNWVNTGMSESSSPHTKNGEILPLIITNYYSIT
jgi:hypothetical protein